MYCSLMLSLGLHVSDQIINRQQNLHWNFNVEKDKPINNTNGMCLFILYFCYLYFQYRGTKNWTYFPAFQQCSAISIFGLKGIHIINFSFSTENCLYNITIQLKCKAFHWKFPLGWKWKWAPVTSGNTILIKDIIHLQVKGPRECLLLGIHTSTRITRVLE